MIHDISAVGASLFITATKTFPNGFFVKHFSDDNDPFDASNVAIADTGVDLRGDMVKWATLNLVDFTVSVIPGSEEDLALSRIWQANRCYPDHIPVGDEITITKTMLDGKQTVFSDGIIIDGPPALSGNSEGRLKTNTYSFRFTHAQRQL